MEPTRDVTSTDAPAAGAATAPGTPDGKVWFPALDGLRAIAALLVVVFHTANAVAYFVEPLPGARRANDTKGVWVGAEFLARFGNWGVAIFFLLSGFLLYRPFVAGWFAGKPAAPVGPYLARRLVRIVPAYWVALSVYLFVIRPRILHAGHLPGGATPYFLFYGFAQIYRKGYVVEGGGLSIAWTLCIEMSFYLLLPLLAWGLRRLTPASRPLRVRVLVQVGALAVASVVSIWLRRRMIAAGGIQPYWIHTHFAWFGIGMAFAVWHAAWTNGARLPSVLRLLGRYPGLSWLFGLQAFWLTTRIEVRPWVQTRDEQMGFFLGNGVSAALLLAPLVFGDQSRGLLRATLSRFPLRWLGELSYGVYLWHPIWLLVVGSWIVHDQYPGGFWPRLAAVLVLTLATAQVSLVALERPLMRTVQQRLAGGRSGRPAPALPAGGAG